MAYVRHDWVCGETITEQKMNNIEDGIEEALECCSGGVLAEYYHSPILGEKQQQKNV